jgi:glycosyltransferase involved in cell wall biosynthesis
MSLGRAIVSTSIGAEGLDYSDGENILIADDALAFANAIIKTLQQKQLRINLGNNAQKLVLEKYDNKKLSSAIIDFCKPYLN